MGLLCINLLKELLDKGYVNPQFEEMTLYYTKEV